MKTLNQWMDNNGISPEKAAEIFGKSVGTIRNWRSAGVPENQREWVEKRMVEWNGKPLPEVPDRVTLKLTAEQFDAWSEAALANGKILRKWVIDSIDELAANNPHHFEETPPASHHTECNHAPYTVDSAPTLGGAERGPASLQSVPAQRGAADLKAARLKKLSEQGPAPCRPERVADEETLYETNGNTNPKN
jgi:hypothetical protein